MPSTARRITRRLSQQCASPAGAGRRTGVEHEYTVTRGDERVDFRTLITTVPLDGRRIDPGDCHAHRCRWGGVVTADGREAEIASPPEVLRPGFAHRLTTWAGRGRVELERLIPGCDLAGYSTHLSVECADRRAVTATRRATHAYSLPLLMLMDDARSPGLLMRPRRGRVEICGDFVDGAQLQAAAVFAAAAVLHSERTSVAALVEPRLEPSTTRFGWYVDRTAFGPDIHVRGRATALVDRRGRVLTAQSVLAQSWQQLRPIAAGFASDAELESVDLVVDGRAPLPGEARVAAPAPHPITGHHGSVIDDRQRGAVRLHVRFATWSTTVFDLAAAGGPVAASLVVPDALLDRFLDLVDDGRFDTELAALVDLRGTLGPPDAGDRDIQAVDPATVTPAGFITQERNPISGRLDGGGGSPDDRSDKRRADDTPSPNRPNRTTLIVAGGALAVLIAGIALATSGGDDLPRALSNPPTTIATPVATPVVTTVTPTSIPVPASTTTRSAASPTTRPGGAQIVSLNARVADVTGPPENLAQFASDIGRIERWTVALAGPCDGGPCTVSISGAVHARVGGIVQLRFDAGTYRGEQRAAVPTVCNTGGAASFVGDWTTKYALRIDPVAKRVTGSVEIVPDRQFDVVGTRTCNYYRTVYELP